MVRLPQALFRALGFDLQQVSEQFSIHSALSILGLILRLTAQVNLGYWHATVRLHLHLLLPSIRQHVALSVPLDDLLSIEFGLRLPRCDNGHVKLLVNVHLAL